MGLWFDKLPGDVNEYTNFLKKSCATNENWQGQTKIKYNNSINNIISKIEEFKASIYVANDIALSLETADSLYVEIENYKVTNNIGKIKYDNLVAKYNNRIASARNKSL